MVVCADGEGLNLRAGPSADSALIDTLLELVITQRKLIEVINDYADYIDERVLAGDSLAEATQMADVAMERTFPGGSPAPNQLVGRVLCEGKSIGELWVGPFGNDPSRWWVWDVVVQEGLRGRGYGRKTMLLADAANRGVLSEPVIETLDLAVFARA